MAFSLVIGPSFKKRLARKSIKEQGAIYKCIDLLSEDPRHPGLHTRRIVSKGTMEARASGANRIEWEYGDGGAIILLNHCSHDRVYR